MCKELCVRDTATTLRFMLPHKEQEEEEEREGGEQAEKEKGRARSEQGMSGRGGEARLKAGDTLSQI